MLIGLSFGWWVPKHNAHHAHPNEMGRDPDIGEGAAQAPSDAPGNERGSLAWWLARWQAPLFFPLMLLRSSGMHVLGIKRFLQRRDRASAVEASLILLHAALYLTVVLWVLSPLKALAFVAVQQGSSFCAAADLGYREESFVESFRQIVHHLSDAGVVASRPTAP